MDDASREGVVDLEARGMSLSELDFPNRDSEGETEPPGLLVLPLTCEPMVAESGIITASRPVCAMRRLFL